jgi:vancomycin resistance protein YoaR
MKKIIQYLTDKFKLKIVLPVFLLLMLGLTIVLPSLILSNRILPGVSVANISVARHFPAEAYEILKLKSDEFLGQAINLSQEEQEWQISPEDLNLAYNLSETTQKVFLYGRRGKIIKIPELVEAIVSGKEFTYDYSLNEAALEASISAIAATVYLPEIPPSLTVIDYPETNDGSKIDVKAGEQGKKIDTDSLRESIDRKLSTLSREPIDVNIQIIEPAHSSANLQLTKMRAERILQKKLLISYSEDSEKKSNQWELTGEGLIEFLSFDGDFDREKIASYSATLAESINRAPENATFVFDKGRVQEFNSAKNGLELSLENTEKLLADAISKLETGDDQELSVELPITTMSPSITNEDVNTLGIKELLGRGSSTFHGSIANREHNIVLSSSRVSGYLIPPGETFSFNKTVGDVSGATGYRRSYIIKDGRTILDDGGGVCQVSTTLFRAVLDAGLPIVERRAHSYRVIYYEQNSKPGYDATVFAPSVDLKFKNNTPAHILIQTTADTRSNSLVFEIYGTSDGRKSSLTNHRTWDVTPPPPDLYQDDPTLPVGVVKQVDWKAWGAKVKYDYQVERDGETIFEKTFYSNFRPWQSIFLRGAAL